MISLGYDPQTGTEHRVPNTEPHPGAHLLAACPCRPVLGRVWQHHKLAETKR